MLTQECKASLVRVESVLYHAGIDTFCALPLVVPADRFVVKVEGKAKIGRFTVVGGAFLDRVGLAALNFAAVESVDADNANRNRRVLEGRDARLARDPDKPRRILSLEDCLPEVVVHSFRHLDGGPHVASEGTSPRAEKVHRCTFLLGSEVRGLGDDGCCCSQLFEPADVSLWHWRVDEIERRSFVDAQIFQSKDLVGHFVTILLTPRGVFHERPLCRGCHDQLVVGLMPSRWEP